MTNVTNLKNGDIVFLKSGAMGVISKVFHNFFGDDESVYEVSFLNERTSIRRSKDFVSFI